MKSMVATVEVQVGSGYTYLVPKDFSLFEIQMVLRSIFLPSQEEKTPWILEQGYK